MVGGQFGSEGKGKVAHEFARTRGASVAVRVGGANSGHTVIGPDGPIIFKQLPTAAILPDVICVIPAGSYIDADVLLSEASAHGVSPERLLIDPNAVVITELEQREERASGLREQIGSTQSGTGAAIQRRIARDGSVQFAGNDGRLDRFVRATRPFLRDRLNRDERIIIEGTQGFGLSLYHSDNYPYVTSRDTTAAGFVSEAGLSPIDVDEVVLVIRAFPIRVAGHSGPLPHEIDWEKVTLESGSETPILEYTSVTGQVRRVARFDATIVRKAIEANRPSSIVLNHVDYVDIASNITGGPTKKVCEFVNAVEKSIGTLINFWGFGPASITPWIHSLSTSDVA